MVPSSWAERVLARSAQVATTIARVLGSPIARWNVAYCAAVMGAVGGVACWGAQASSGPATSRRAKVVTRHTGDPPGLGREWCLIGALMLLCRSSGFRGRSRRLRRGAEIAEYLAGDEALQGAHDLRRRLPLARARGDIGGGSVGGRACG